MFTPNRRLLPGAVS